MTTIYYINLDRVPERRKFMEKQLAEQGLTAVRIPAVDAFDKPEPPAYTPASWMNRWSLSTSEIACFESHRIAWRQIRDGSADSGVILEDDVLLSDQFSTVISTLSKAGQISDVIKLDGINQISRFGPISLFPGGLELRKITQTIGSAAAYIISRESATQLEAGAEIYCDHLDDYIFTPRKNWTPMQMEPAIAVQGMFIEEEPSCNSVLLYTSERTSDIRINQDADKGPPLYRILKEIKRLRRKLQCKLGGDRKLLANGGTIDRPKLERDLGRYRN